MIPDAPYRRVYHFSGNWGRIGSALIVPVLAAVFFIARMSLDEEIPTFVPVLVGVGFAALIGFLAYLTWAGATVVDDKGVTVRGAFRRRSVPWPQVQGIEIQNNPGANEPAPQRLTVLYDAHGKRYFLPHLHDRAHPDLEYEVAELREAWVARRGADWVQVPEVAAKIDRVRRAEVSAWLIGLLGVAVGYMVAVVVFIVALATDVYAYDADNSALVDTLTDPLALMVGLPLTFGVVTFVVTVLRRRRRRPA